jgi:hypothetical protein
MTTETDDRADLASQDLNLGSCQGESKYFYLFMRSTRRSCSASDVSGINNPREGARITGGSRSSRAGSPSRVIVEPRPRNFGRRRHDGSAQAAAYQCQQFRQHLYAPALDGQNDDAFVHVPAFSRAGHNSGADVSGNRGQSDWSVNFQLGGTGVDAIRAAR